MVLHLNILYLLNVQVYICSICFYAILDKIIACGTCTTAIATGTLVTRLIDCKPHLFIYFPTGLYHNTPDVSFPQSSQCFPFGCSLEDSECPNYCQLEKKPTKKEKAKAPLGLWGRIKIHFRIRRLSAMWWPFAVTHKKYKQFYSAS